MNSRQKKILILKLSWPDLLYSLSILRTYINQLFFWMIAQLFFLADNDKKAGQVWCKSILSTSTLRLSFCEITVFQLVLKEISA